MTARIIPFTGYPDFDTIAFRKIDANTFEVVFKKGGKEVSRALEVFSKDGKTFTFTEKGTDAKGQDMNNAIRLRQAVGVLLSRLTWVSGIKLSIRSTAPRD